MLDRRNILKFLVAGAAASLLTPLPWKLMGDSAVWTQNWPWIPAGRRGEVSFARTSSKLCPSASGMRVQLVGGRPVRLLPDPEHPLSQGGISALALAEAQLLYSPARVRGPLLRDADGALRPASMAQARDFFLAALRKAGRRPDNILCLCGDETGSSSEILSLLTRSLNSSEFYFMPSELQPAARAAGGIKAAGAGGDGRGRAAESGERDVLPAYNLEDSDFILCLGADILECWGTVMRNSRIVSAGRGHLVYGGPCRTATALAAAKWLPVKPGTEGILLLGLANLLLKDKAPPPVTAYTPEAVCAATGVSRKDLHELFFDLSRAGRPLVITGSLAGHGGGTALARLGFIVNQLLPGGALSFMPGPEPALEGAARFTDLARNELYARAFQGGTRPAPEVFISYDANPMYALPASVRGSLGLEGRACKIAFSSFLDETALAADLVLPLPLGLERLDDVYTPFGSGRVIYSLCPQIIEPVHKTPPPTEVLFTVLNALGVTPRGRGGQVINGLEDLLKAKAASLGADYRSLLRGEAFMPGTTGLPGGNARAENLPEDRLAALARDLAQCAVATPLPKPSEELFLAPLPRLALGTAVSGIPPYTARLISARELQGQELVARVNARTARRLGLKDGQRARLCAKNEGAGAGMGSGADSGAGSGAGASASAPPVRLAVRLAIFEGIMDNVVGLPLGYGHTAFDEFSQGRGVNGLDLYSLVPDGPEPGECRLAVAGLEFRAF